MENVDNKLSLVFGIVAGIGSLFLSIAIAAGINFDKSSGKYVAAVMILIPLLVIVFIRKRKFLTIGFLSGYVLMVLVYFLIYFLAPLFEAHNVSF